MRETRLFPIRDTPVAPGSEIQIGLRGPGPPGISANSDRPMLKPKPWEIFCAVLKWKMTLELVTGASGSVGSRDRLSQAIRAAERETALHLRHDLQWSLINSHLMAARLAAAAEKWIRSGTGDPDELRSWLRAAWCARWSVHLQEEQRCRETEHALAGGSRGGAGAESMNSPAEAGEHVFELYI